MGLSWRVSSGLASRRYGCAARSPLPACPFSAFQRFSVSAFAFAPHPAAQAAVTSVAETALNNGNLAVADKARRELVRVPSTTNTNLEARKKEILSMRPLLRGAMVK